jgi:hypothetical protein
MNDWKTLPLNECKGFEDSTGEVIDLPLEECEGLSGFSVEDMAKEVKPNIKKLGRIKDDYCIE